MEAISFNRLNIQAAAASASVHPSTGLLQPLLKNTTVNTSSISPRSLPPLQAGPMWGKIFIHLFRKSFPEQLLQQVGSANEDNFELWLDGIPLFS